MTEEMYLETIAILEAQARLYKENPQARIDMLKRLGAEDLFPGLPEKKKTSKKKKAKK
jgi:hypothetical protein